MSYFDVFGSIFEKSAMTDLPNIIVSMCLVSYNFCMIPQVWTLTFGLNLSGAWGEFSSSDRNWWKLDFCREGAELVAGRPNARCDVINRIISTDGDWRYPFLLCWTMRIAENHVIVQCFIFFNPQNLSVISFRILCEEQKQEMVASKQNYQTSIFWFWHYHVDQSLPDIILDTLWLQCLL